MTASRLAGSADQPPSGGNDNPRRHRTSRETGDTGRATGTAAQGPGRRTARGERQAERQSARRYTPSICSIPTIPCWRFLPRRANARLRLARRSFPPGRREAVAYCTHLYDWDWSPKAVQSRHIPRGLPTPPAAALNRGQNAGSSVNGSRHTGSAVRRLDANDQQWLSSDADRLQRYPNCSDCVGLSR